MPPHAATRLTYKGRPVSIDSNIVDVMQALWAIGIETMFSCEDNPPRDCPDVLEANAEPRYVPKKEDRGRWFQVSMSTVNARAFVTVLGDAVCFGCTTYMDSDGPERPGWVMEVYPVWATDSGPPWDLIVHFFIPWAAKPLLLETLRAACEGGHQ